jgi:prepilin signal peptidase PulO-like enzyme (type II secretory pathway)
LSWVRLGFWLVALVMLIILAVYDARWLILPDKVTYPLIGVGLAYAVTMAVMIGSPVVLERALEAALLAGGGFWALVFFSRGRAMGGGDIKLAVAMGLLLGVKGTALALLVAFNVAALVGIGLIMAHRKGRRDQIPFGPFLVLGTVSAFWFCEPVVNWYLRVNGLG